MENKPKENNIIIWIRKDFNIIVVCLVALLVCMYALYNIGSIQEQCNEHWITEMKTKCSCCFLDNNLTPVLNYPIIEIEGVQNVEKNNS